MPNNIIILENIRSAYNTGNIIRTADALGRDVILSGYTPDPSSNPHVAKSSLGAEQHIHIQTCRSTRQALDIVRNQGYRLVAAELTDDAIDISLYDFCIHSSYAIVVGNEVTGVLPETLDICDDVVYIPMQGIKASLNVGQAAAICMWQVGK